ncbi:4899_t:CDS:2, partial [Gigaspora margarita]
YESLQENSSNSSSFSDSNESLSDPDSEYNYSYNSQDNSSIANNIFDELAIVLRLFKIKVQYNLTDEAFQQTMIAANIEPITNYVSQRLYKNNTQIGDVFDSIQYKELVQDGHLQDERDVALLALIDGYQIFKQKTDDLGINCYDVLKKEYFTLRTIIISWSGIYIKHIYYPTTPPKNFNSTRYQVSNLPIRTHEEWKRKLKIIQKANPGKKQNEFITSFADEYKEKFLGPTKHLVLSNAELKKIKALCGKL